MKTARSSIGFNCLRLFFSLAVIYLQLTWTSSNIPHLFACDFMQRLPLNNVMREANIERIKAIENVSK